MSRMPRLPTTRILVTAVAMNMMASYPLVQALLVLKPLPTSSRQPCLSRQRSAHLAASALPGSHKLYASGDAAGAAAAAAAAPSTELTSGGEFGGPITRAEALTGFFAGMVSTAVVLTDMSRARAVDDGLGVMDDLLTGCPSTPTCVSSQDDRPYPFMEPWTYEGSWERAMKKLRTHLEFEGAKVGSQKDPAAIDRKRKAIPVGELGRNARID